MATKRNVRYSPLSVDDDNDYNGGYDPRFDYTPKAFDRIPWKSIILALFLLCLGSMLLFLSFFILRGHMGGERPQAYGLLALGILTFVPGFYESRIAYYSWRGVKGYRFSSIPALQNARGEVFARFTKNPGSTVSLLGSLCCFPCSAPCPLNWYGSIDNNVYL